MQNEQFLRFDLNGDSMLNLGEFRNNLVYQDKYENEIQLEQVIVFAGWEFLYVNDQVQVTFGFHLCDLRACRVCIYSSARLLSTVCIFLCVSTVCILRLLFFKCSFLKPMPF